MIKAQKIADWLESHWIAPAYIGCLLSGLFLFFFVAASNTMAGWLYVISGIGLALLAIAAILPERILRNIDIRRNPITPVSAGDLLTIELVLKNTSNQSKTLIQVQDLLPYVLSQPVTEAIETIAPHGTYVWNYSLPTQRRGIYRWQSVQLRTAAPLGLFWCQRSRLVKAIAVVYPTVLPLTQCPLIDEMGRDRSLQFNSDRSAQSATEGITRSLRPYRWGDPTRLVHWRTSARYSELRVRELEVLTGGQELVICLDSALAWEVSDPSRSFSEVFEQAVTTASSLYFYARHRNLNVKLWTAGTGLVQGNRNVLEALAGVEPKEDHHSGSLPSLPLIWLTQTPVGLSTLPPGSRWVLWKSSEFSGRQAETEIVSEVHSNPGIVIQPDRPLQLQLQGMLKR
ncbi:DUF58 domain-containing protein [Kovacikia minuta CCNUW1]|uniref:DUF58 domain-containing protein n=1 Tax=Kovacikia minuta TaxID=2931930 RepID=UPI001CCCF580|nr:DUF58 domain-containing protein [Kovacikia minuta]UBF28403.1 DUF58 domain-containing protein [Kovacikia minuta CCNUW1]